MYTDTVLRAAESGPDGDDCDIEEAVAFTRKLMRGGQPKKEQRMSMLGAYKYHLSFCRICHTYACGGHLAAVCE